MSTKALIVALTFVATALAQTGSQQPRAPDEAKYKSGYVNLEGRPPGFSSAMLWGIAVADTRVPGYENAIVEIAEMRLTCRVNRKDVLMNDDHGKLRGGLYRRHPWFATDVHDAMPMDYNQADDATIMRVGTKPDKVWHFWAASPRASFPEGKVEGCTVRMRVKISPGALLQIGMDYWKNATVEYGPGGNNHEAGASDWYGASPNWQEAVFTDESRARF
jgi:hypothetical protein